MITNLWVNLVVLVVGALFSLFPAVTKLPTIYGFDIDASFVSGFGQLNTVMTSLWPLKIMFQGFIFLMGYYALKMGIGFLLGHRTPGRH